MKVGPSHSTLFLAAHLGLHFVRLQIVLIDRSENLHSSIIIGAVQPREEKALGRPESSLSVSKGELRRKELSPHHSVCRNRTRGNGFKLRKEKFILDIRKKVFSVGTVKHWHRLSREVVDAPSLETFKMRLDEALSNLM